MSITAMKQMVAEMEYVLSCINENKMPFDGDDFHEALRLGRQAIAEAEKERCVCCEACIDTACGREECPKGWPKVEKQEPANNPFDCGLHLGAGKDHAIKHRIDPLPSAPTEQTEIMREKIADSLKDFHKWTDLIRSGEAEVTGITIKRVTPQRQPLTDEQWQVMADTLNCLITRGQKDTIESALGIKGEA